MTLRRELTLSLLIAPLLVLPRLVAHAQTQLRVGAAKVSITPPDSLFPYPQAKAGFVGVHDPIYARAIVVDDGSSEIAMVGIDFRHVPHGTDIPGLVAVALGIPADHVMVSATHDHNTSRLDDSPSEPASSPKFAAWLDLLLKGSVEAARQAKAALQPARVGFGTGLAYVNVNRDEKLPDGRWDLGYSPDRPTDKTVAVIRFDNMAGEPIAIYSNYAVHGVVMYESITKGEGWEVTGDLPGNTSRYVEDHYGKGLVDLWTSGAAGDQNPIYMSKYNQQKPGTHDEGVSGYVLVDVQSRRLGEEIVRVADEIKPGTAPVSVWGTKRMPECPGQHIAWDKATKQYTVTAQPPVGIPLTVLTIGDIAIGGVAGEPVSLIGQHLKAASPSPRTIFVNHAGPTIGYIPTDASYPLRTFEVTASKLKEGCSEPTIVNGLVEMIKANPGGKKK